MDESKNLIPKESDFLLYTTPEGNVKIEVFFQDKTVWLTQQLLADLFNTTKQNVSLHLKNIFEEGELIEDSVVKEFLTTASDGKKYKVKYYNLDAIIAVGYRINSKQATNFRIWATHTLREYIIKGFAIDDERLKQGKTLFGQDYFKELLERVRSIRASERRIYQQITDIFAECSIDYDPKSEITKNFCAMVQNKFHYAIAGLTAAEIIYTKADKNKPFMGLTTWKHSPKGRILKSDTLIAKNYLPEDKIKRLERTVSGFFDYIENVIENHQAMKMEDLAKSVNKFLSFNEYKILQGKGQISHERAEQKAIAEYDEFNKIQKIESDFDREVVKRLQDAESKKPKKNKK
ncbi:MAG: cell filamentation protein Fic [Candidatus Taylorbacteria bacterium RIFOXYD2_FULL_36_9]|uniref:Cell filamentation protein Fic n=1 Tax=Candidatus Taylorbacteria bacterium RIFOXYD2_FULL_36_9 TaxID=1802338 RepID=A0A1G2PG25_9BACT|nr:MAG: cell filamentation protein Fic [Candidatus Taylorbacteria bacterium RIFOXYD2_FULL_36_9]